MMPYCKKILLIGGGGHCLSVVDTIKELDIYEKIGIIDKETETFGIQSKKYLLDVPIVGNDNDLEKLYHEGYTEAFITVGSIGNVTLRNKLYEYIKKIGFHVPNIIDKSSVISKYTILGEGIYIGKNTTINANVDISNMAIINTSSVIEHECKIGEFVHIAPGSILCGGVCIGDRTHIGAGSIVKQGIQVGCDTVIGMGSVVLHDINSNVTAYGNPCREKRLMNDD